MYRIVAVTPAGRERYLRLLAHYIMADESIAQWQLWDNCRDPRDRACLDELAARHPGKISVVRLPVADGTMRAINHFYPTLTDPQTFYLKLDDDVVYLPPDFGRSMLRRALPERGKYAWWSPLVINNALCSWLLKYQSRLRIDADLTAQASCVHGWRSPQFALALHRAFLEAARGGRLGELEVPSYALNLARFSINCLGMFGRDIAALGGLLCPPEVDDEEWLSAVLPVLLQRPGRIIGDIIASHFSFYTQEPELLESGILGDYYELAGLSAPRTAKLRLTAKQKLKRYLLLRLLGGRSQYELKMSEAAQVMPVSSCERRWNRRNTPHHPP
jgi:hypothetical protein